MATRTMAVMAAQSKADMTVTMPMAVVRKRPHQPTVRVMAHQSVRMAVVEPVPAAAAARLTHKEAALAVKVAACTPKTMVKRQLGPLVALAVAPVEAAAPMEA